MFYIMKIIFNTIFSIWNHKKHPRDDHHETHYRAVLLELAVHLLLEVHQLVAEPQILLQILKDCVKENVFLKHHCINDGHQLVMLFYLASVGICLIPPKVLMESNQF